MAGAKIREEAAALGCDQAQAISTVSRETGQVTYRGYAVDALCRRHSFEEVAYLLWHGELPTYEQVSAQNRAERAQRALGPDIAAIVADQPPGTHPIDILQAAVSVLGAQDPGRHETGAATVRAKALRVFAVLPAVIAMDQRHRHGLGPVAPRDHLSYAANFLCMTLGQVPEPQVVAAFEKCLILNAGPCFGGSAVTAPVASGPVSNIYTAVGDRIGALQGPLQAGAGDVVEMLNQVAIPDNAKPWVEEALADARHIAGFDGRPEKKADSRVPAMRAALGLVATLRGGQDILDVYDALAAAMFEAKRLHPRLDCPTGPALHLIGFGASAFGAILAAARLPSWTARIAEELAPGTSGLIDVPPAPSPLR
jgi:citrate synthase